MIRLPRPLVRIVLTAFQQLRRTSWALTGRQRPGVHAVALTPEGRVVLVRLSYAKGWRLPGGGVDRGEGREEALLRELREEIGLLRCGAVEPVPGTEAEEGWFVVRDVEYRPVPSYEIEEVGAFEPSALPAGMPPAMRALVAAALRSGGSTGTGAAGASLALRTDPEVEKTMSRIPSKAMPHAYAPREDGGDSAGGEGSGGRSIAGRAGEIARKVGGSRAAQVAAGAAVAAGVAAAATKIVRGRRRKGEGGGKD